MAPYSGPIDHIDLRTYTGCGQKFGQVAIR